MCQAGRISFQSQDLWERQSLLGEWMAAVLSLCSGPVPSAEMGAGFRETPPTLNTRWTPVRQPEGGFAERTSSCQDS